MVYVSVVKIIPVKLNKILKQEGQNITNQSRNQNQPEYFEEY